MTGIRLNVIEYKKDFYYHIFRFFLKLIIVYWLLIFIIVILNYNGNNHILFTIGLLWMLVMVLFSIIKKTYTVIGTISITDEYVESDFLNKRYLLNELQDFKVDLSGYKWQPHIIGRIITFSNGISNTISFEIKDQRFAYRFLIKSKRELEAIEKFLNKRA